MEALVDFSKTEWQESIYSLNKYLLKKKKQKNKHLLSPYSSSAPETQCHRAWHTVRVQ